MLLIPHSRISTVSRNERAQAEANLLRSFTAVEKLLIGHLHINQEIHTGNSNNERYSHGIGQINRSLRARRSIGLPPSWRENYGASFTIAKASGDVFTFYRFFLQLPLYLLAKKKVLKADLAICLDALWYENIRILGGHIRLNNVIPTTSDAVKACLDGNVSMLRELLRQRRISVSDVTDESRPLLWACTILPRLMPTKKLTT